MFLLCLGTAHIKERATRENTKTTMKGMESTTLFVRLSIECPFVWVVAIFCLNAIYYVAGVFLL